MNRRIPLWLALGLCAATFLCGRWTSQHPASPATSSGGSSPWTSAGSSLALADGQVLTAPPGHRIVYRKTTTTAPSEQEVHSRSENTSQGVRTDSDNVAANLKTKDVEASAGPDGAGGQGAGGEITASITGTVKSQGFWYIAFAVFAALALLTWLAPKIDPELKPFANRWIPLGFAACAFVCFVVAVLVSAQWWVLVLGGLAILVGIGAVVYLHYQHAWEKAPDAPAAPTAGAVMAAVPPQTPSGPAGTTGPTGPTGG